MELSLSNFGSLCRKRLLQSTHCSQRCPVPIRSKIKSSNKYQQNPAAWEIFTVSSSKGFHSPDVWCNKQPICKIHHRIISPNNYIQQMEEQLNSDISQFRTCQLFPLVFKPTVRDAEAPYFTPHSNFGLPSISAVIRPCSWYSISAKQPLPWPAIWLTASQTRDELITA